MIGVLDYIVDDTTLACVNQEGKNVQLKATKEYISSIKITAQEDPEIDTIIIDYNENTKTINEDKDLTEF